VEPPARRSADSEDGLHAGDDAAGDAEHEVDRWWCRPIDVEPLDLDRVVVVDIETTGLDAVHDHVRQLAAEHLGTGVRLLVEVDHPGRDDGADVVDLAEALATLDGQLATADAVAGHRVAAFDLPFLHAAARRSGVDWQCDLPALDLHTLSLLVDPTLPGRRLTDLADHYG